MGSHPIEDETMKKVALLPFVHRTEATEEPSCWEVPLQDIAFVTNDNLKKIEDIIYSDWYKFNPYIVWVTPLGGRNICLETSFDISEELIVALNNVGQFTVCEDPENPSQRVKILKTISSRLPILAIRQKVISICEEHIA